MSKVRIPINPMQVGKVGAYSMYVRRGEQVVRQRKNSSNYGEEASRSISQQSRRILWSNLVNFYRVNQSWMQKAFESLKAGQTIYNRFMQLNIDKSQVALTKQEAFAGACLADAFAVSDGKLPAIRYGATSEGITPVYINTGDIASTTGVTLGQLSAAIIEYNTYFQNGDNIAWVFFVQNYFVGDVPRVVPNYMEITLNTESTTPLSDIPAFGFEWVTISNRKLAANSPTDTGDYAGFVCIHTRRANGLQVSPQKIFMTDTTLRDEFSSVAQQKAAIDSYGVDAEVPLQPSFKKAVIESAAVDGSQVLGPLGGNLSYGHSIELTLSGLGMTPDSVQLLHDGILYTPVSIDDDGRTWKYILGSDGVNNIWLNGILYARVTISGIVMPVGLPTRLSAALFSASQSPTTLDEMVLDSADCINYPRVVSEDYDTIRLRIGSVSSPFDMESAVFEAVGGEITATEEYTNYGIVKIKPLDATQPFFLRYDGYIVLVSNYAQPQ
jgi:hypothetical protein